MSYNSSNEKRLLGNPGLVRTVFPLMGIVNMLFYLCVVVAEAQECQGFEVCMIQGNVIEYIWLAQQVQLSYHS